jgi:hypothetical protein
MSFRASSRFLPVRARRIFFLLPLLIAGAGSCQAQVIQIKPKVSACDRSLVEAAMEVSSLKDMGKLMFAETGALSAQMEQDLRARGRRLPAQERDLVLGMMQQAFAAEAVDEEIGRSIRSQCEPKIFAAAVSQLRAPIAAKMRGFEDAFYRSHSPSAISRYAAGLEQHPPTEAREALAEAMEKTVHNADFEADLNAQVFLAMYMVVTGKATNDGQLLEIRERMMPAARKSARLEFLITYRNAADEELDQYILLLRSPELQRFQTIWKSAVQNAVIRRAQVMAALLKQHMDARSSSR